MSKPAEFAAVLTRLRESAGFPTAFAFHKSRDGRRALGLSFPNYLKIERGVSLPQAKRLEPLLSALGLVDSWMLAESAARQAIGLRKVQLSLEQYRTLAKDAVAYACHAIMANTQASMTGAELAKLTGRSASAIATALAALERAGLAKLSGPKARSPFAGQYVTPPALTPLTASIYAALQKHRREWEPRARHSSYLVLRARKDGIERYLPHLADAVNLSAIYGDVKPAEDSGFYLVEARVSKLFR